MSNQGHWVGEVVDPKEHFGFIYLIKDTVTGYAYVGRKQVHMVKQGVKGCRSRVVDRGSPKWKHACWKESNWKTYSGSSKRWTAHMKKHSTREFVHIVLKTCRSKGVLTFSEVQEQWARNVLGAKLPDGTWAYANGQVGAVKFRPADNLTDEHKAKIAKAHLGKPKPKHDRGCDTAGWNKGLEMTDEYKQQCAEGSKGNTNRRDKRIHAYKNGTKHFVGMRADFIKAHDLHDSHVGKLMKGERKTHKGWTYVGAVDQSSIKEEL